MLISFYFSKKLIERVDDKKLKEVSLLFHKSQPLYRTGDYAKIYNSRLYYYVSKMDLHVCMNKNSLLNTLRGTIFDMMISHTIFNYRVELIPKLRFAAIG